MPRTPDSPTVAELRDAIAARDSEIAELQRELVHWRTKAIAGWAAGATTSTPREAPAGATSELTSTREALSWRVNLTWRVNVPLSVARRVKSTLGRVKGKVTGR